MKTCRISPILRLSKNNYRVAAIVVVSLLFACDSEPLAVNEESPNGSGVAPSESFDWVGEYAVDGYRFTMKGVHQWIQAGHSPDGMFEVAESRANRFMEARVLPRVGVEAEYHLEIPRRSNGIFSTGRRTLGPLNTGGDLASVSSALSAGQQRYLRELFDLFGALDENRDMAPARFDAALAAIKADAVSQLGENDAAIILMATSVASALYREYHDKSPEEVLRQLMQASASARTPYIMLASASHRIPVVRPLVQDTSCNCEDGSEPDWTMEGFLSASVGTAIGGAAGGAFAAAMSGGTLSFAIGVGFVGGAIIGAVGYTATWATQELLQDDSGGNANNDAGEGGGQGAA